MKTTKRIELKQLSDAQSVKMIGKVRMIDVSLKNEVPNLNVITSKREEWAKGIKLDKIEEPKMNKIQAIKLSTQNLSQIERISNSTTPTAEAIKNQKMGPEEITAVLFTALTTLEYSKMKSEYQLLLKNARTEADKKKVNLEWKQMLEDAKRAYKMGGLDMSEADMDEQAKILTHTKSSFNNIATMSSKAEALQNVGDTVPATVATGGLVTINEVLPLTEYIHFPIPDLCSKPFAQGSFTKHFGKSFSLSFNITYWCPSWRHPFKTCTKKVTLASLSFSVDVNVGYRITCCGATVWGQASAQVCGSILGFTKCASCVAQITGVAGFGRTGSGGNCTYGLGVSASLKCMFGSTTLFNVQAPFGWNIQGPCPPAGLC